MLGSFGLDNWDPVVNAADNMQVVLSADGKEVSQYDLSLPKVIPILTSLNQMHFARNAAKRYTLCSVAENLLQTLTTVSSCLTRAYVSAIPHSRVPASPLLFVATLRFMRSHRALCKGDVQ